MSGGDVERYWHQHARSFDRLYSLPPLERLMNRLFRRAIYQRYDLTFEHAGDVTGKRVLDAGSGSGRHAVEFARRGAAEVVGVDFAADMLALANAFAAAEGVVDRTRFVRSDFDAFTDPRPFDVAIGIGFFDYVGDPLKTLRHMHELTRGRVMASFPKPQFPRSQLRTRRYAAKGVHIHYYTKDEIQQLARDAGFNTIHVIAISAGYFLVADT
jgi:cyclopropane fatty-acyl-phospholipid synthase-like methyltransferase